MFNSGMKIGVTDNPLTQSVFNERFEDMVISQGDPLFIITESELNITTENGEFLETEG